MPKLHSFLWLLPVIVAGAITSAVRADLDKRIEIEARGPIHEAFAQPWQQEAAANEIVAQEPPAPIAEEPPDEKPAGKNVQWMPGYWQWDDDKKDFLWVSGFWRDVPDGRRWVMGYWAQTADGWRYVSGHWAAGVEQDLQYVPQPPTNLDVGPSTPAPDADSFYIPGSWFYSDVGYRWRPGYWTDCRPGLLWAPARYFWTQGGWCFASGYWDYALAGRGLLFPPVWFADGFYRRPGFIYRPAFAIAFNALYGSLFVRTGFGHYYFGDYYGRGYLGRGFQPWATFGAHHYDPLFAHERWANRGNPQWLSGLNTLHSGRVNGTLPVPPHTLVAQNQLGGNARTPAMLQSLSQIQQSGTRLQTMTPQQRTATIQNAQQMLNRSQQLSQTSAINRASTAGSFRGAAPTTSFKPASANFGAADAFHNSSSGFNRSTAPVTPQFRPAPQSTPHFSGPSGPSHSTFAAPGQRGSVGSSWHGGGTGGSFHAAGNSHSSGSFSGGGGHSGGSHSSGGHSNGGHGGHR